MSKLGLTVLKKDNASHLSPHFGIAKWILIYDRDTGETSFARNEGLTGQAVVEVLVRHGCTDAVFSSIGNGALAHLNEAGIRGWYGPTDQTAVELAALLEQARLERAESASHVAPRRHRRRTK